MAVTVSVIKSASSEIGRSSGSFQIQDRKEQLLDR